MGARSIRRCLHLAGNPDDVVGRVKTYESIVKGNNIPKPGIPESFKVLIKELQSLALDIKVLDKDNNEIDIKQSFDDDDDMIVAPKNDVDENPDAVMVADDLTGFGLEDENGDSITEDFYDDTDVAFEDESFDDGEEM